MNADDMTKSIAELVDKAVENAKKAGKISSYSRITYDEIGRPLVDGIQIAINDAENETLETFTKLLKEIEYKRDFSVISEERYYKQLEALRDNYLIKGSGDWWKYTAKIIEYEQSLTMSEQQESQLREEIMDKAAAAADKYYQKITESQIKYANKLKAYGDELYAVREVTTNPKTGATQYTAVLTNYEAYTNRLKNLTAQTEKLKARGIVPDDLLREITSMDIDKAAEYLELLNRTSDEALKEYVNDRSEYLKLCEDMAQSTFGYDSSPEALKTFTETMEGIFEKAGLVLPDNFYDLGKTGADSFGDGFTGELENVGEEISDILGKGFSGALEAAAQNLGNIYYRIILGSAANAAASVVNNVTNSFTVGTEKQSAAQQISAWRNAQQLERLRGV